MIFITLSLLLCFTTVYTTLVCPIGINPVGNTCYSFHYNQKTWGNARSWCKTKGNDLLVVRNDDVYNDIKGHISQTKGSGFWLGASDQDSEGNFRWVDGTNVFRQHWWVPGEPNDAGSEDCVDLYRSPGDKVGFNDHGCKRLKGFICEHKGLTMCIFH